MGTSQPPGGSRTQGPIAPIVWGTTGTITKRASAFSMSTHATRGRVIGHEKICTGLAGERLRRFEAAVAAARISIAAPPSHIGTNLPWGRPPGWLCYLTLWHWSDTRPKGHSHKAGLAADHGKRQGHVNNPALVASFKSFRRGLGPRRHGVACERKKRNRTGARLREKTQRMAVFACVLRFCYLCGGEKRKKKKKKKKKPTPETASTSRSWATAIVLQECKKRNDIIKTWCPMYREPRCARRRIQESATAAIRFHGRSDPTREEGGRRHRSGALDGREPRGRGAVLHAGDPPGFFANGLPNCCWRLDGMPYQNPTDQFVSKRGQRSASSIRAVALFLGVADPCGPCGLDSLGRWEHQTSEQGLEMLEFIWRTTLDQGRPLDHGQAPVAVNLSARCWNGGNKVFDK